MHSFRAANLFVWVDNDLVYEGKLAGTVKKRMGFIKTVQGNFSDTLALAPGRRVIRVQVASKDEGYNQTKEVEGEWIQDGKKTLAIGFSGQSKNLHMALQ